MSEETRIIDGAHRVEAWGTVTIISHGDGTYLSAAGDGSMLSLDAQGVVSVIAGPAAVVLATEDGITGAIDVMPGTNGTINLASGLPLVGPRLQVTPNDLSMAVGPPILGASLSFTETSITLSLGPFVSLTFSQNGISLTAAETQLDVGVTGIVLKTPFKQETVDAVNVINETMLQRNTDATRQETAGIFTIN